MHELSARQIREKFIGKELSAVEITEYFLERIKADELGAYLHVLEERALNQAKRLDEKGHSGKLAGVPISVKDNMQLQGTLTTCASKFLENYRSPYTATALDLLEKEGALILGKTNLDEFAMGSSNEHSAYGIVRNPRDPKRVPGGSSGGSAVAVAAQLTPFALGSDTGGSIRQPAALCGCVGFKPTYGRISRYGLVAFGSSLDQIGPFANSCDDVGMIMEVMGQHCRHDATSLPSPSEEYVMRTDMLDVRIGVPYAFLEGLSSEMRANFDASLQVMKGLGAQIVEVDLDLLRYSNSIYYILSTAEASTNLSRFDGIRYGVRAAEAKTLDEIYEMSKDAGFGAEVKRRILLGTYVLSSGKHDTYYGKAQRVRTLIIEQFKKAFETCNAIAMPTTPTPAFELGAVRDPLEMYLCDIYTIGANLAGLPAISIPSGLIDGLPVGVQLLGPQRADVQTVALGHAYQEAS